MENLISLPGRFAPKNSPVISLLVALGVIIQVRMPRVKSQEKRCLSCNKGGLRSRAKYCSIHCQMDYQYKSYIKKWKRGQVDGLQNIGVVSGHVKRYLREKFGNKCCLCGWSKVQPFTNKVPLVADHIDGNWRNNKEENLRLLCPNCDSLTSTYCGLNRENGRKNRAVSNRIKEAVLYKTAHAGVA